MHMFFFFSAFWTNANTTRFLKGKKYISFLVVAKKTTILIPIVSYPILPLHNLTVPIEGDPSIARLSLVCRRWRQLAQDEGFRKVVHFKWLNTVHDWTTASEDFKTKYYVMYEIIRCLGCNRLYKDTAGFSQIGGTRGSLRFYSDSDDAGHPGFCTPYCASVSGFHNDDPLADLE